MRSTKSASYYAVVTAATVAASTANVAHAAGHEMLEACAQHFIAANLAVYPGKIHVDTKADYPLMLAGQSQYQVAIKTIDPSNGEELAAGVCTVNRSGRVVSFKPTSAMSKKLTAKLAPTTVAQAEDR